MFRWKNRVLAMNEAAKLHKSKNVPLEKACDYVLENYPDYSDNVEAMSKKEFTKFLEDTKEFV